MSHGVTLGRVVPNVSTSIVPNLGMRPEKESVTATIIGS